ncbi:MAG: hypothetical protein HZR80_15125 [Candidatus Heimdallarchaeota archaeon]
MKTKQSSIWALPAHITGVFHIVEHENPLMMGSRGAGFSVSRRIRTLVKYDESSKKQIRVLYNNQEINGKVSKAVANNFGKYFEKSSLIIEHKSDFPIQAGYGTSGAGAIGTAFALNEIFETKKSDQELGQMAHIAEVSCRTGLGDVIAQMLGNAEIRLKPGAPGIGVIKQLDWPKEEMILTATLGEISTKEIITNEEMINRINTNSEKLLADLEQNPTLDEFLRVSYEFANKTGLMTGKLKELIEYLREDEFRANMVMLGESLFVIGDIYDLEECSNIIDNYDPNAKIWIDTLANVGPIKVAVW